MSGTRFRVVGVQERQFGRGRARDTYPLVRVRVCSKEIEDAS